MVFEVFRRRQKQMIALLAVLAMFAFVLSGFLMRSMDRGERYIDRPVATAWGEPIMASQIERMQRDRFIANQFFVLALERLNAKQRPPQWSTDPDEVVRALVVLGKAQQLGLTAEDAEVTRFIAEVTNNQLAPGAFHAVLGEVGGSAVSDRELYTIIARELLFDKAISVMAPPVTRDTPLEHWESRLPALTHVQLELVRLPVTKFVDSSSAPPPEEIDKLFAAHKDQVADPEGGIIGFKTPHRVELQYLVADVARLAEKATVSDAEIKQYYDQHKEEFKEAPPTPSGATPIPPKPAEQPSEPKPKTEEQPKTEPGGKSAEAPAPETKPAAPPSAEKAKAEPAEKPSKAAATPTAKPASESKSKPADKNPAESEKKSGEPTKSQAANPSLLPRRLSGIAATALLLPQAPSAGPQGSQSAGSASEEKAAKTEVAEKGAKPKPEVKPGEEPEPKPSGKVDAPAAPADSKPATKPAKKPDDKPAAGKAAAEGPAEKEPEKAAPAEKKATDAPPPPAYKPLEAVRAEIAQRLRREKAGKQAVEQLRHLLRTVMYEYLDAYGAAKRKFRLENPKAVEKEGEPVGFTPPPLPDLRSLGKELGFELQTTGLLTESELANAPLGSIIQVDDTVGSTSFVRTAFSQDLFWGRVYQEIDASRYYLCWKIKDQPARVPELDQVREQVVAAWRLEQARPKAKDHAEKLAEEVRKAGGAFEKALPKEGGYAIERTALFSRKIRRFSSFPFLEQNEYDEPTIPEIPNAGAELLDAVFQASKGDVLVLPDALRRNYYLLKVVERADPDFQQFVADYDNEQRLMRAPGSFGRMLEMQRQFRQTVQAICEEAGLQIKSAEEAPASPPDSASAG